MRWTPRLRTVLMSVNILILAVPVGGVVLLRLYESALIRRTEAELIAQGAVVAAAFREELRRELSADSYAPAPDRYGVADGARTIDVRGRSWGGERADLESTAFQPLAADLDLATHQVLSIPPDALPSAAPADPWVVAAGERLLPVLETTQQVTLAGIRVVDHEGTVVATTRSELGLNLVHREEVARALQGVPVSVMRKRVSDEPRPPADSLSRGTGIRVFVAMPVVDGDRVWGAVLLSRTPMSVRQSLYRLRWHIPTGAVLLVALVILVALLTSRTIGRPMDELIHQTERVARGETGAATPLRHPGTLEMRRVSEAVARMAEILEARAHYINTFASGVSHEFKTPLTSIRGTVELLRDHFEGMTAKERDRFLANLEADAERLDRLVNRLTELARADVLQPGAASTALAPVARALASRLAADGRTPELALDDDLPPIAMEMEVLESVLFNLLDNARQHGGEHVRLTAAPVSDQVRIAVIDDGPGISQGNRRRIFDRFFTTARDRGGSGLGLSIVRTLVEAHGGGIEVTSEPGHTEFAVHLPRTRT
jgi:signal transduction histidine kinase